MLVGIGSAPAMPDCAVGGFELARETRVVHQWRAGHPLAHRGAQGPEPVDVARQRDRCVNVCNDQQPVGRVDGQAAYECAQTTCKAACVY